MLRFLMVCSFLGCVTPTLPSSPEPPEMTECALVTLNPWEGQVCVDSSVAETVCLLEPLTVFDGGSTVFCVSRDAHKFASPVAAELLEDDWLPCGEQDLSNEDFPIACDFSHCAHPPRSTCGQEIFCLDDACGGANALFDGDGCVRPTCTTDDDCGMDARCVEIEGMSMICRMGPEGYEGGSGPSPAERRCVESSTSP